MVVAFKASSDPFQVCQIILVHGPTDTPHRLFRDDRKHASNHHPPLLFSEIAAQFTLNKTQGKQTHQSYKNQNSAKN